jgi:hypothetical protein
MTKVIIASLFAALGCAAPPSFAGALSYNVQTVSFPGDNFTQLLGINDAGTIVGYHGATVNQGFTLTLPGTFADTNFPNSAQTQVVGIANPSIHDGYRVGFYVDAAGLTHGFVNVQNFVVSFFTVDQPGTAFNQVLGISSNAAHIAGYSSTDPTGATLQKAYIGTAGVLGNTFTDINGLLPVNQNSQATGINDSGNAVGFYLPTADTAIGFLDTGGAISTIDPFGSTFTQALGINQAGEIVGFYVDGNGVQHGYVDIAGVFSSFDPVGSVNTTINGVNSAGQLVGFATIDDNVVGFVATPAPEPASWALLGITGIALTLVRILKWRGATERRRYSKEFNS